ncbi:MAG TPA: hypothetical protein VHA70_06305 [Bauldia sp.]|nr:hypothetical protein [Bauldia sp.]
MRRQILPILLGVPLVFAALLAAMVGFALVASAGVPVAVVARGGLGPALAAVLAADGDILQVRGDTVIAIADDSGFVGRLYRSGALLVVRADGGCGFAPLREKPAAT